LLHAFADGPGHDAPEAGPEDVVLLVPAAASFDQYANFEKPGDFVARVKALKVESERLKLGVGRDYKKRLQQG
jgi:hypothetical protein